LVEIKLWGGWCDYVALIELECMCCEDFVVYWLKENISIDNQKIDGCYESISLSYYCWAQTKPIIRKIHGHSLFVINLRVI